MLSHRYSTRRLCKPTGWKEESLERRIAGEEGKINFWWRSLQQKPAAYGGKIHYKLWVNTDSHYDDVIMTTIASQIASLTSVYSTLYSDADQRKHQSSASLAFVWGIHRDRWIPRTKGQLRGKCFHLMTSSWKGNTSTWAEIWPKRVAKTNQQVIWKIIYITRSRRKILDHTLARHGEPTGPHRTPAPIPSAIIILSIENNAVQLLEFEPGWLP